MSILIGINKSITANTYYRIIFSIIIGLLFSFSSQIVLAQSTSASATADKKDGGQLASNGQELRVLAQLPAEELGILPPNIQVELETWMIQQEKRINAKLSTSLQEGVKQRATIAAYETINRYQKVLLAGGYLKPDDKATLRRALDTPGIDGNLKEKLIQYTLTSGN